MAVLSRWQATITDEAGNVVPNAWIEVRDRLAVGSPLASIYEDRAGLSALGNPFQANSSGYARLHAQGGVYRIRAYLGPSGAPTFERVLDYVDIGVDLTATYAWTGLHSFTQPVTLTDIVGEGSAARSWALGRHPTGAGAALTLAAGGAKSGGSNLAGGDLVLAAGISTGNAGSTVRIRAATPGTSGTADRAVENTLSLYRSVGGFSYLSLGAVSDWWVAAADGTGDVYYNVPTSRSHIFRIAGADKFTFSSSSLAIAATTASTSTITGAATIAGGLGVAGDVWTGGYIAAAGNIATASTTASTSSTTGALRSGGGLGVAGAGNFGSYVAAPQISSPLIVGGSGTTGVQLTFRTTSGSGTTDSFAWMRGNNGGTLAMTLNERGVHIGTGTNGLAAAGDITLGRSGTTGVMYFGTSGGSYVYFDGTQYNITHVVAVSSTTASTSTTTGSGTFAGGIGVAGNINAGGWVSCAGDLATTSTSASTTTTTGALRSGGGLGVVGDANIGGYIAVAGNISGALKVTSLTGIGYRAGAGGTVTQATSKSTGVTLNKATGEITTPNNSLAASTTVSFTLTNSLIEAADMLAFNITQGTAGAYTVNAKCAAGSATVELRNVSSGALSEAVKIRFSLIKAATT